MHNNTKYIDGKVLILQQKQPNRQSLISNLQKITIKTVKSNMKRIFIIALSLLTLVLNANAKIHTIGEMKLYDNLQEEVDEIVIVDLEDLDKMKTLLTILKI